MADNVVLNPGADGDTIAADDVGGVKYQIVKLATGAADAATVVSSADPLPVAVASGGIAGATHDSAAASEGIQLMAVGSATAPTAVSANGDAVRVWATTSGALNVADGGGSITVDNAGTFAVQPAGAAAQDAAVSGNPVPIGLRASTATPTAMSADGDVVYAWADRSGAQVVVGNVLDDAAFTPGTNRVMPVGYLADETATDSVDEGDIGAPRITLDRKQIVTPYAHAAAGGCTPYKNLDVDETEDDIKTSAGKLFWIHVMNMSNAVRYLKIYNNVASSVTVGTTVPDLTFPIPTMADTNGAGFALSFGPCGMQFTTGICIAATTGLADNNSGAPGANEVVVNAGYA